MTKIIVTGATGRMGSRITALSNNYYDLKLIGATEKKGHDSIGKDIGTIVGIGVGIGETNVRLTDKLEDIIDNCDVIIDFTSINSTLQHIKLAAERKKAMVIGTTGFSKEELESIKELSKIIPIVLAPNMSVGVNLLLKVLQDIARVLGDDYDIEIVEAHHRLKKDAPSGTAMKMAQVIADAVNRDLDNVAVYTRKGLIGERTKKEIGIQTLRGGDVVGEHTVFFYGLGERIEITHKASSRDTFARGALKAALWIANRTSGLYDMQDVLGLK
jgi:4-hydroxy-tetrahydrodipicolinate reductase